MTASALMASFLVESFFPVPEWFESGKTSGSRLLDAIVRGSRSALDFDSQHRNRHLCKFCRRLTLANLERGLYHRKDLEEIRESSSDCSLCLLLLAAFAKKSSSKEPDWPKRLWIRASGEGSDRVSLVLSDRSSEIRIFCDEGDAAATLMRGRPIRPYANCAENFDLAKLWLADCQFSHPECASFHTKSSEGPLLPTRVIDVGSAGEAGPTKLRITNGQRGKWVALSHCWGNTNIVGLTNGNYARLQEEIADECLPQTFRDAIFITRKLNVRYLWIDSLCILQDSKADWQTESTYMPMIYANAQVVLAANATPTSHGGILTKRPIQTCSFDMGHLGQVGFGLEPEYQHPDYLGERAWCFQEEHLGRRRLTFYNEYMEFSCSRSPVTERHRFEPSKPHSTNNGPESFPRFRTLAAALTYVHRMDLKDEYIEGVCSRFYGYWIDHISEYSRRRLTVPCDKLVAISGIAQKMKPVLNDEYLAGLWLQQLPSGLLWRRLNSCLPLTKPIEYRAPSWSWASVEGEIHWLSSLKDDQQTQQCEVVEAEVVARGQDPFSQVADGFMRIRARIKTALVGSTITSKPFEGSEKTSQDVLLSDPQGDETIGHLPSCMFDTKVPAKDTKVLCMEVCSGYVYDMAHSMGLTIEPMLDQPGKYQRTGMFLLSESRWEYEHGAIWFEDCEEQVVTIV